MLPHNSDNDIPIHMSNWGNNLRLIPRRLRMFRLLAGSFTLALLVGSVVADDKTDPKEKFVSWERESNGFDLKFEFGKEIVKLNVFNGENGVIVTCKMTIDKKGLVKATVKEVEEKGTFPQKPKIGFEFSFTWKIEGDKATLSDLMGEGLDEAKPLAEGEYKKKK
jgi:hypothetical protein